jgi:hypothetical protein
MGFYYRRSVNLGPFRVNLSKSGVGYSVGGKSFRVGQSAKGKRYTTFSVPGTGIHYRSYRSCLSLWLVLGIVIGSVWILNKL